MRKPRRQSPPDRPGDQAPADSEAGSVYLVNGITSENSCSKSPRRAQRTRKNHVNRSLVRIGNDQRASRHSFPGSRQTAPYVPAPEFGQRPDRPRLRDRTPSAWTILLYPYSMGERRRWRNIAVSAGGIALYWVAELIVFSSRRVDRMILLDSGRISAEGTHASLYRESALYRSLYEREGLDNLLQTVAEHPAVLR
jgi:hypothetical protein